MTVKRFELFPCSNVPQTDRRVITATDKYGTIWAENNAGSICGILCRGIPFRRVRVFNDRLRINRLDEGLLTFSGGNIPERNRVATATGERLAIRTKRDCPDIIFVFGDGVEDFMCFDLPETNGIVSTATGEHDSIRTERQGFHACLVFP